MQIHIQQKTSIYYKQLSSVKKTIQLKWTKDMKRHFKEEDMNMANKHTKRCSLWLAIRKMQVKTTREIIHQMKWLNKKWQLNADEDTKKLDHSYIDGENVKYAHFVNTLEHLSQCNEILYSHMKLYINRNNPDVLQ